MTDEIRKQIDGISVITRANGYNVHEDCIKKSDVIELVEKLTSTDLLSSQMYQAGTLEGKRLADAEMLDALKKIKSICDGNIDKENSIWYMCNRAIQNAEPK